MSSGVTLELDCVGGDSLMMGGRELCLLWFGMGSGGLACEAVLCAGLVPVDLPGLVLVDVPGWFVPSLISVLRNTTGRVLASIAGGGLG